MFERLTVLVRLPPRPLLLAPVAAAQDRVVPPSAEALRMSYAPIVKRVAPAVVNVSAAKTVENRNPLMDDPFFRRFFGAAGSAARASSCSARSAPASSSIRRAGRHQQPRHRRRRPGQSRAGRPARVRGRDRAQGPAHRSRRAADQGRRTSASRSLDFGNSDELQVGDLVLAIGNPFGVGQTVTTASSRRWPARRSASPTTSSSFRPTPPSIPAIPAARWSTWPAAWSASTPRSSRARAARTASASPSPPTWCAWWWPRRAAGGSAVKRPWLGAKLQAVTPELSTGVRPQAAGRRGRHQRHARQPGGARRPQARRRHRLGRRPGGRRPQRLQLPLHHACRSAAASSSASCAAAARARSRSRWKPRRNAARRDRDRGALAVHRRQGGQPVAGAGR